MRIVLLIVLALVSLPAKAQHDFEFGNVSAAELSMTNYFPDSTADAVVLREYGRTSFSQTIAGELAFEYHVVIKVLREGGLDYGNVVIPTRLFNSQLIERISDIQAASYTLSPDGIITHEVPRKQIYTENYHEVFLTKFAIPGVQVGSVIEYRYRFETPDYLNFRRWDFQNAIPKIQSEYWCLIPANYVYKMALRGSLQLKVNESLVVRDCFEPIVGSKSDCTQLHFAMDTIPAFREEPYMTAASNFLSSIQFELSEIKHFTGGTNKISRDWRDVNAELESMFAFGRQLRQGGDIISKEYQKVLLNELDKRKRAEAIYKFINSRVQWDGRPGKYAPLGLRKAFQAGRGSVGDLNLMLVASLRQVGLDAHPVILSTRENGVVTDLYPVLSQFNYVVAMLTLEDNTYFLDATDPLLPFGMLPLRCFNGRGRVIDRKNSRWVELVPQEKMKLVMFVKGAIDETGGLAGQVQQTRLGYDAYGYRSHSGRSELNPLSVKQTVTLDIANQEVSGLDSLDQPVVERFTFEDSGNTSGHFIQVAPFLNLGWNENPFRSLQRRFPVDFAVPVDERITIQFQLPKDTEVVSVPSNVAIALPEKGGKFVFTVLKENGRINISSWLTIDRTFFPPEQYPSLRELFNAVVRAHTQEIVLERTPSADR